VSAPAPAAWRSLDGLRYGALGLPLAFLSLPLYVTLPSHYAANFGMPLALLGMILLATRALDALADPFLGQALDRVFARAGQGVLGVAALAACGVAAGFAALFFPLAQGRWLALWLAALLLLTYLCFSVLSVLHQAWGARLGGDAAQRARIVAWREGLGLVGVLVASVLPGLFGMGVTTVVLAALLLAGLAFLSVAPRAPSPTRAQPQHWALPWRNPGFRSLLGVFMLNGIASAVPATLVLFFVRDRLQASESEALFLGAYFLCAALSTPLWVRAVRTLGLACCWLIGMAMAIAAFSAVLALGAGDSTGFLAVCCLSGLALGADLTIPGALLTGVIRRAGHAAQAEGVYLGWWNSATKLNLALAAGAALPLLAWAGYAPGQRDAQALNALSLAYVAVPCTLKLMAAALLVRAWTSTKELE
jgi:Na+/melibiose symporter-like transporter